MYLTKLKYGLLAVALFLALLGTTGAAASNTMVENLTVTTNNHIDFNGGNYSVELVGASAQSLAPIGLASFRISRVAHLAGGKTDYQVIGIGVAPIHGSCTIRETDVMNWRQTGYDPKKWDRNIKVAFIVKVNNMYIGDPFDLDAVSKGYSPVRAATIEITTIDNTEPYSPMIWRVI